MFDLTLEVSGVLDSEEDFIFTVETGAYARRRLLAVGRWRRLGPVPPAGRVDRWSGSVLGVAGKCWDRWNDILGIVCEAREPGLWRGMESSQAFLEPSA